MLHWKIERRTLELKYTWKISRNASDTKTNLFVNVTNGESEGTGEVAPNVRYNETPDKAEAGFQNFLDAGAAAVNSLEELTALLATCSISNALRFGIESAYIHFLCSLKKISIPDYLGIRPAGSVAVSFSIPIMEIGKMKAFYVENNLKRFRYIKVKVNADEMEDAVKTLSAFCDQPLIVDANEAFLDVEQCIRTLEKMKRKRIEIVEQPLPAGMNEEGAHLKKYAPFPLFADESVTDVADFGTLRSLFDGVNIKLMKTGGYLNAVRLLQEARANGMKTMIGCMVETTLAISSGLHLCSLADYADLDSFLVVKNEPFGLVQENEGVLALAKKENSGPR